MPPYKYTDYSSVRAKPTASSAAGSKAFPAAALYTAEHQQQFSASSSATLAAVNHTKSAGTNADPIPTISGPKHANIHTHTHTHLRPNAYNNAPSPHILRDIRKQVLPVKLSRMLSDPNFSDIISWMPHGRAWKVLRPRDFTERVAPIYFEYPNYNSFIRLVNAWGFRRITTGVDTNAYFHELFLRDMPHLHKMMRRLSKNEKKTPLDPNQEPDFYKMPPLPSSLPLPLQLQSLLSNGNANVISKNVVGTLKQTLGGESSFSHGQGHGLENGPRRALPPAATAASSDLLERLLGATGGGGRRRGYLSSSSASNAATTAAALQLLQELSPSSTSYSTNALAPNNTSTNCTSSSITSDEVYRTILDTISTTKGQPPMNSSAVEELAAALGLNGSGNSTSSSSLLSSSGIGRGVGSMMGIGNGMGNGNGPTSSSLLPSEHDTFTSTTTTNPQILRLLQSSSLPSSSSSTRPSAGAGANVPSASSICSSILSSLHPQNASSSGTTSTTYADLLQLQMQAEQQQQKKERDFQGLFYLKNQQQQQQQNQILALKNILQQQARNENLYRLYRHERQHHLQTTGILQQQKQQQQTIEDLISIPGGGVRGGGTNMLTNVHVGPTATTTTGGVLPSALPGLSIASPPIGPLRHAGTVGPVPPVHLPVVSTVTSSASSIGTAASTNQMSLCSTSTSGSGPNVSPSVHLARFAA